VIFGQYRGSRYWQLKIKAGNIVDFFIGVFHYPDVRKHIRRLLLVSCSFLLVSVLLQGQATYCGSTGEFQVGSCVIDMGVQPQTDANGLKPFGLLYQLVNVQKIPVYWSIKPGKIAIAEPDFTLDGLPFSGGPFIIPAEYVAAAQATINTWVAQGVVVHYAATVFTPPVYQLITYLPKVVLDEYSGDLIQSSFYNRAGVPASAYTLGGIPSMITKCDDIYVLPHANPETWPQSEKDKLYNFITSGGWLFTSCKSVSAIESVLGGGPPTTRLNFLSNTGLILWNQHNDPVAPYTYNPATFSDPFMQFVNKFDDAFTRSNGLEQVYLPLAGGGWRPTTTIAVTDPDFALGTSPGPATLIAYGRAYGSSSNGMIMYFAGHSVQSNTVANAVAASRVYGNFWIKSGLGLAPTIMPGPNPSPITSGSIASFSATATSANFMPSELTWQWSS
jgi:hypothetical protein